MTDRPETAAECAESLRAVTENLRALLESTGLGRVASLRTDGSRPTLPSVFLSTAPGAPLAVEIEMRFKASPRIRYWRLSQEAAGGGRMDLSGEMFPARWERQARQVRRRTAKPTLQAW